MRIRILPILVLALVLAPAARAAVTLDELLEQTRNARKLEEQANAEREKAFLANRDQQAGLLAEAQRKRDAAEARSKALSATFDANEVKLAELDGLLTQRLGSLGELFGVVRQVAGDTSSILYNSLISAQYPGRDLFFTELGKAKDLPSIEQLERLWFEIQREMTESGQVVRFPATRRRRGRRAEAGRGGAHRRLHGDVGRPLLELSAERRTARRARAPADR